LTQTQIVDQRRYKGFNLLAEEDASLFRILLHGEFAITGFTNKALRGLLPGRSSAQISRLLKRLRVHKLIKKTAQRYKYYLTDFGREVTAMVLKLRELHVVPALARHPQP
jgi:DNA-binding HxlR family transcriptional regulator